MRLFGIISLILVLLTQSLSTTFTVLNFELNREAITELFCINKEQPDLHCDGKCYLKKQIEAEEESHSEESQTRVEFVNLIFTVSQTEVSFSNEISTLLAHKFNYFITPYSGAAFSIFHPPRA